MKSTDLNPDVPEFVPSFLPDGADAPATSDAPAKTVEPATAAESKKPEVSIIVRERESVCVCEK